MKKIKIAATFTSGLSAMLWSIIPEKIFTTAILFKKLNEETNIIINRLLVMALIFVVAYIGVSCILVVLKKYKKSKVIRGRNYQIVVEYGDILDDVDGKRIISFDECFTTKVGKAKADIKEGTVCGQYLLNNKGINIQRLVEKYELQPCSTGSKYQNKTRYESGSLLPYKEDLLMAFAKLDYEGIASLTYDEYLATLNLLWKEINAYSESKSIYMPLIGAGKTRIGDTELTKQELLDIIIGSYKLSHYKLQLPAKLHIVCKGDELFSLADIGETLQ